MIKRLVVACVVAVFVASTVGQAPARRGGGGARMGGMRSMSRPMPSRPSTGSGGFDFNRDMVGGANGGGFQRPEGGVDRGDPGGGMNRPDRPPAGSNRPDRPPVAPINPPAPAWGWNGGVVWYPAPTYWGGGFWGPFGIGFTTAVVYGEVTDEETQEHKESYQVQADSPGAKVLANYGLTQTQCGPADLVHIYGPNNSIVCTQPNQLVAAGSYNLDVTNLTITTRGSAEAPATSPSAAPPNGRT